MNPPMIKRSLSRDLDDEVSKIRQARVERGLRVSSLHPQFPSGDEVEGDMRGIFVRHPSVVLVESTNRAPLQDVDGGGSHPFKGTVVDNSTINVASGKVHGFYGAGPMLSTHVEQGATDVSVSGSGSIWLEVDGSWGSTGEESGTAETIENFRLYPVGPITGYTTTDPTEGTTWDNTSEVGMFFKILTFATTGGELEITDQIIEHNIWVDENYVYFNSV